MLSTQKLPSYTFAYRRRFSPFVRKILHAVGHTLDREQNKMFVLTRTGGQEITNWSSCSVILGEDWILVRDGIEKANLEKASKGNA